jgi:hypothetical protein
MVAMGSFRMTALLALVGAVGLSVSAAALPSDAPTPSIPSTPLTVTIDPVPAFSGINTVQLTGTKDADSTVTLQPIAPSSTAPCPAISGPDTTWTCVATVPNGPGLVLTAVETLVGDSDQASTDPFDVLGPPIIAGAADSLTTGLLTGQGYARSTVTVAVAGAPAGGCTSVVDDTGYWSCSLAAPSGAWSVTATQSRSDLGGGQSSSVSGSLDVVVDKDAPAPPVITSPLAHSRIGTDTVTYRGTGEANGSLEVYLDNAPVCSTQIGQGAWSCNTAAPANGSHTVYAIQRDAAGNYSAASATIPVVFGPAPATGAAPPSTPSPTPTPTPVPSTTPGAPQTAPPIPPFGAPTPTGGPHTGWNTPTAFGETMPTLASSVSDGNWMFAPLVAIAFLLLIAMPLRLLATALRGRIRRPTLRFTGRNRTVPDVDPPAATHPRLAALAPFAAATALILIAGGVNDEPRYLRLAIAIAAGLAILNLVGVALPVRLAGRRLGAQAPVRILLLLLVAAAITALLSRFAGLTPPLVTGVLIGTVFAGDLPARRRGRVQLLEVLSVTVLAVLAWAGHDLLESAVGFLPLLSRELLAAIALAGLGSAIVMVLPIASLPGRTILEWSTPIWTVTAFLVATVAAAMLLGSNLATFPVFGSLAVAASFAALSLAVWAWFRYVEPAEQR